MRAHLILLVALLLVVPTGDAQARKKRKGKAPKPVAALTKDGRPNVQSASAIVVDLDRGVELYAKNADTVRPIASTTKLFVAMVVLDKKVDLTAETAITAEDRKRAQGGAKSRLLEGRTFTNHDLMRAMMIGSDNRAVTALARGAGLSVDELIAAMNAKARALGLTNTSFTDPSGLNGNLSTAREMVVALRAALAEPVIADIMATKTYLVTSTDKKKSRIQYNNTNQSLRTRDDCIGGKTGFTDEAGYCLAVAGKLGGRRVGMVFLGSEGELTRFADYGRVAAWIDSGAADKGRSVDAAGGAATRGVGALADPPPPAVTSRITRKDKKK